MEPSLLEQALRTPVAELTDAQMDVIRDRRSALTAEQDALFVEHGILEPKAEEAPAEPAA